MKGLFDDGRAQSDVPVRVRGLQEALDLSRSIATDQGTDESTRLVSLINALLVLETGAPQWTKQIESMSL